MTERPRPTLVALLALAVVPWTVLSYDGGVSLVFAWGLANPSPPGVVLLSDYLLRLSGGPVGLPERLLAWPVATLLYLGAATSAVGGRLLDREDRRVTGGLLVFAGLSHLGFSVGMARTGVTPIPVGPVLLWAVAWWAYRGDLRAIAGRREYRE